jgi:phospholipid/cholesterol/gamma-HCH transport system permease protein
MVVNEEVDALTTMGFDPIRFLAVPKVLATIIVVPILTVYADLFGVLGGMIIGVTSLDLTVKTYITQSIRTIQVFDVVTSLIKAAVFAALIAAIGCQRGFQVRAGAQDVGKFTTSAVVAAIFLIVVADSIFAIMLYYVKDSERGPNGGAATLITVKNLSAALETTCLENVSFEVYKGEVLVIVGGSAVENRRCFGS